MITGQTKVITILADPVSHLRTPQALNEMLEKEGVDAVMVSAEVSSERLADAVCGLQACRNFIGMVVTVPHKTAMPVLCDHLSARAQAAQSVNVVRRQSDGSLYGDVMDGAGFVRGLDNQSVDIDGKRVFLAGAGGAASAIAFALSARGIAALTISNRSADKAEALATRLSAQFPQVQFSTTDGPQDHDIAINGTSLGLNPDDALPFDPADLSEGTLVAEVVMQPAITPLLVAAEKRALAIQPGSHMLSGQLSEIFHFLTKPDDAECAQ